ncbi:MAG: carboxypeptidase-like regulatory domain-containing protein, partial [Bacteroidota bacterium]
MSKVRFVVIAMVLSLVLEPALAGPSGKIAGTAKDKKTGEPLIGCNVVLEGTMMGASTDIEGQYVILNVPPGTYTLVVSLVGYGRVKVTEVKVNIDLTTTIDVQLLESFLELGQEVVFV